MVTIVSSFAEDIYIDENEARIKTEIGGPAKFLSSVLDELDIDFFVVTGAPARVVIKIEKSEEFGKIEYVSPINLPDIQYDLVIVSTLLNEFKLRKIKSNLVCLDIQGYVRNSTNFGTKKNFEFDPTIVGVVKATERELNYLPVRLVEALKKKVLIVTQGSNGFTVYAYGNKFDFSVEQLQIKDAVGAGDTFFAAFCVKYYKSKDPCLSAEFAKQVTDNFLKGKAKMEVIAK